MKAREIGDLCQRVLVFVSELGGSLTTNKLFWCIFLAIFIGSGVSNGQPVLPD